MENLVKFKVKKLSTEETNLITGGDRITRAIFGWLGGIIGHLESADRANRAHGATGYH